MAGCQVPTEPLYHSSSNNRERKLKKSSWAEIRTGRSVTARTDPTWGN